MSAASEALADVRGWLCDNLSEGDAGKVCGMLSVVSQHIAELEDENAKLRELCKLYAKAIEEDGCYWCPHYEDVACDPETVPMCGGCGCVLWEELRELGIEVEE